MKCSSRRNCDLDIRNGMAGPWCLNEVQFPKELRLTVSAWEAQLIEASMKCRSRKNCDRSTCRTSAARWCLNEVQFPKELRLAQTDVALEELGPQ